MRERGVIHLQPFSFQRENRDREIFRVHITDAEGTFTYDVRGWTNMVRSVDAFTSCIAYPGASIKARADLFKTGYALVNGFNVRVTPLS